MTIDWKKPIETEDGLPARLLSTDFRMDGETVMLVQIEHEHGSATRVFRKDGTPYWLSTGRIRNRKTKREGWVNVYRSSSGEASVGALLDTEEEAKCIGGGAVATIKIEWEE